MIVYPAIDIKEGRCVRLKQGNFNEATVYNDEPWKVALQYCEAGASYIHIVDLDGARAGSGVNNEHIKKIIENVSVKVQVGGGIRNMRDIEEKFALGADRVILGTSAVKNPEFVRDAVREFGERIAVGIDATGGLVAISGWEEVSEVSALKLSFDMRELGVKTIIYTDIARDGMMTGPNTAATKDLADRTGMDIIASGGVSSLKDLTEIKQTGASGVIIGKALFTGAISLADAIRVSI